MREETTEREGVRGGRGDEEALYYTLSLSHAWSSIAWLRAHRKWLVLHTFAFSHNVVHKYESEFRHPPWRKSPRRQYETQHEGSTGSCRIVEARESNVTLGRYKIYTRVEFERVTHDSFYCWKFLEFQQFTVIQILNKVNVEKKIFFHQRVRAKPLRGSIELRMIILTLLYHRYW